MRKSAFTLMELMVGMVIIAVTTTVIIANVDALGGQTAKREAEKLAHWLTTLMTIADSRNDGFTLTINANVPTIEWASSHPLSPNTKKFEEASEGCSFRLTAPNGKLEYRVQTFVESVGEGKSRNG